MKDYSANNKQDLGRLRQFRKEKEIKISLRQENFEKTGHKIKFINKDLIKKKLEEIREQKKLSNKPSRAEIKKNRR